MFLSLVAAASPGVSDPGVTGSWTLLIVYFCIAILVSFFCYVWEAVILSVTNP
jgi:hypothetical protein